MNFLTTKQVSELWGITPRRIVQLAVQGRINGAKQIDGRWFIPENAAKPVDPRKERKAPQQDENERYIFPFLLGIVSSSEQFDGFTTEEKELYRLCLLYENGSFTEARTLAEKLLTSSNRYIFLGALYHLPTICMYLSDFKATEEYYLLFRTACEEINEHKTEINILLQELDAELVSFSAFAVGLSFSDVDTFPPELLPLIASFKLMADLTLFNKKGIKPDITSYEIICRMAEEQDRFYYAMIMHLYLSVYYALVHNPAPEYRHMKRAFEIGVKHETLFTLSYTMFYNQETMELVLNGCSPALIERVRKLAAVFVESRNAYADYRKKKTSLAQMNDGDYRLVSCCLKGYSIDQMAECFGLTRSGISKRLANLYGKLGVKSKKELVRVYLHSVLDWSRE